MKAYLLSHSDDLAWVSQHHGQQVHVIAHEDHLPVLLGEDIPLFFAHDSYDKDIDDAVNFFSFNWYRDEDGKEICETDPLSIADAFSAGLFNNVGSICREYFPLKYWCERYDCVYVSCNESAAFLSIAKKFGQRVQVYDPGHRQASPLASFMERVLIEPQIDWRANFLRKLQTPFLWLLHGKTLTLSDWTQISFASVNGWIAVNSRWPWLGAYARTVPGKYLSEAEQSVPSDFGALFKLPWLAGVLQRIDVRWDADLLALLSEAMVARYQQYRHYFVLTAASYLDMLDAYRPAELIVNSEMYEPDLVAAHIARSKGIKTSWLPDGYLTVDIEKRIGKASVGPVMFERVYAGGCQHQKRLLKTGSGLQEVVTVPPPLLDNHVVNANVEKTFDAIIMTWIPNSYNVHGRNGSRPNTLLDALAVATQAGFKKIAIKIKHHTEHAWLLPMLEKVDYAGKVTLLEGLFSNHIAKTHRVIGGLSSAIAEAAHHGVPYYIYEPLANGYSAKQIASAVIISGAGVARTPAELRELLKRSEGSITNNKALLFGTQCPHPEWTWDQTRELYTSWAAQWADRSGIKNALQWRGFPLWWASNLIAKDTAVDFAWYQALHDRLRGMTSSPLMPLANARVYGGLLKSMVKDVGKWLLLRLLPSGVEPAQHARQSKARVWFHSLDYNFIHAREGFCDRMYEQVPLDDHPYGFTSAYVVRLHFKLADFLHPLAWLKKIQAYEGRLQRKVEIIDRHLSLTDIIGIHASLIKNYFQLTRLAKAWQRQGVRIGHAEFSDILISEMQKSFLNALPWSLSYGAMFERWLQKSGTPQTLITYGETLAPMRPVYFATQKQSLAHRWISIQHATIYKNKMGFYHHHSEFNRAGAADKRNISPMPDYYFVHGTQFAHILSGFYPPDRIRVTGCLKYDSLFRIYGQGHSLPQQVSASRMLLLAPSVGDEEIILKMLTGLQTLPGWRVMLSKHPTVSRQWIDQLIQRNNIALKIEFDPSKSTAQLMESASLVVCSYSGIALESFFVGVPSVRVLNLGQPPMVEDEPGLAYVTNQQELLQVMSGLDDGEPWAGLTTEISATLDRYFYKFDGLASMRFWTALGHLNDLPLKHSAQV